MRARWVKRDISARTNAGMQKATRKVMEEHYPDTTVERVFERKIEKVVKRRNALITVEIVGSLVVHSCTARVTNGQIDCRRQHRRRQARWSRSCTRWQRKGVSRPG